MSYDRAGNPNDLGAGVAAGNRLTSFNGFTMTYDNDGNMLTRVGPGGVNDTYVWGDFGQLKSVTRSGIPATTFAYDGFGRRIRKTSTVSGVTQTIHYIWDGDQIFAETDGSGTTLQSYSYNPGVDEPRSVTAGGQVYYMSTGLGGDVNGLIKQSNNTVAAQYTYTPWGGLEADQQLVGGVRINSLRWRGLPYDSETGLYQVRARYYDPATRRFISEDPIGIAGGINLFTYGDNDPINRTDPTGLDWCYVPHVYSMGERILGTVNWPVPCPNEGSSIEDSPWGDPTQQAPSISTLAVANTLKKIAAAQDTDAGERALLQRCTDAGVETRNQLVGDLMLLGGFELADAYKKASPWISQSVRSLRAAQATSRRAKIVSSATYVGINLMINPDDLLSLVPLVGGAFKFNKMLKACNVY